MRASASRVALDWRCRQRCSPAVSSDLRPDTLLRRLNNRVNDQIAGLHDGRDVFFLDINKSLTNADGTVSREVMPDLLHLSEKGYRQWARAIAPTLEHLTSLP